VAKKNQGAQCIGHFIYTVQNVFSSKIRRFVEQNRLFTGIYYKISMHQQGKMYTIISLPMNCLKQNNVAKAKH